MNKLYLTAIVSLFLALGSLAQEELKSLPHRMTPGEELRRHEIGRDFVPTGLPTHPVRMVAEYEHMQSVLIRYPFGIPMALIVEMSQDCPVLTIVASSSEQQQVQSTYQSNGVNMDNTEFLIAPSDSYWTRDYGPWFIVDSSYDVAISNHIYNRPRPNDNNIPIAVANYLGIDHYNMPLITAGGNWMCDGIKAGASTELIWEENPSLSHDSVNSILNAYLGIEKNHVLDDPLDDYIKHIDCWGKFLDVDKVLIGQVPSWDYRYPDFENVANYFAMRNSSWGNPYQVYRVYTPGNYPNTPYTNSLILNKKVFVPVTGGEFDDEALQVYEEAMPGYEIIGVYHSNWENTDALHCRTKGIADLNMLYIDHMPLLGQKNFRLEWDIVTDLIPYSGYGLKQDSLLLYYSVDSGAYQVLPLEQVAGSTWEATIPFQEPGSEIAYYLHAVDFSGKVMEHPYIGQPDPHRFVVKYATDVVVDPDTLVFTTPEEMILGKSFNIMNFTSGDLDLTYLETESSGAGFAWYAEPDPGMPLAMEYGDTLSMTVFIEMPVDGPVGDFVTDTMDIISEYGAHQVIIKVDPDLLSGLSEMASAEDLIVMPNPMADRTKIEFNMVSGGRATLLVSDMEGKAVRVLHEGMLSSGQHTFYWDGHTGGGAAAVPGAYLIELRTAAKRLTGKVIKSR